MNEIKDFFFNLFKSESWPARWHCGRWTEFHGWLYILSDVAIWAAYFTIPVLLISFISKKKNVPFPKIFWLFGAFILACGTTHLIDAAIFWIPIYRVSAIVRFITAIVSWGTIIALYKILPQAFSLKTSAELEKLVNERTAELYVSSQKIRFLADAMPQMVWTAQPDGSVDYVNVPALKYTGKSAIELKDWKWMDIIHPEDRQAYLKKWKSCLADGTDFEMESRLLNAHGLYYWNLMRAQPQRDNNAAILMWVGTATHIEMQKRTEELLENSVQERTEQLRLVNEKLVESNADLEHFAAIASHDLQSPLRTMSNYIGILAEKNAAVHDEHSKNYITKALEASDRMTALIQNLFNYTRATTYKQVIKEVDLNKVMKDVLANLDTTLTSQNAVINYDTLPTIIADESQMLQLFQNIISNAIKYNDQEIPVVTITASSDDRETQFVIADNGLGMNKEDLTKIFEVFTRLRSDKQGTGLGLSICKRIIEKHGGKMWVDSQLGIGTQFFFTIPKELKKEQVG